MGSSSGYEVVSANQLTNIVWAVNSKAVSGRAARVYFGCFVMIASRLAASRLRRIRGESKLVTNHYRIDELQAITGLTAAVVKRGVRELAAAKLLSFSRHEISISKSCIQPNAVSASSIAGGRSLNRPVPMSRAVLRYLATERSWTLAKVMLAYSVRGLTLARKGGEVKNRGTVKASWIADRFGLSIRSVRYARQKLYELGWISPDTGSFQRKLNRDGAYFAISLTCSLAPVSGRQTQRRSVLAPRTPKNAVPFAPPIEDKKTSNEVKNQKTPKSGFAGVLKGGAGRQRPKPGNPSIRRIVREDLSMFDRLHELYRQAVKANWLKDSEANALNFVGAAVRAREAEGDSARIFVSLVKRALWQNITQAQEEKARQAMNRFREVDQSLFRPIISFSLTPSSFLNS